MSVQVLAVTDTVDQRIYSASLKERMDGVQLAFSCGDVPAKYLEFIVDALNLPLYYVLGNHADEVVCEDGRIVRKPLGARDIGGKVVRDTATGLLIAGLPGSPRYNDSDTEQYSEFEMYWKIIRMVPRLIWNRLRYRRALDVLITHSPPRDLNDAQDQAHRGFKAIRTFLKWFKPTYHLHGHVHLYDRSQSPVVCFRDTTIINVYPYQVLDLQVPGIAHETDAEAATRGYCGESQPSAASSGHTPLGMTVEPSRAWAEDGSTPSADSHHPRGSHAALPHLR